MFRVVLSMNCGEADRCSWHYFGRHDDELPSTEAATLTVLLNRPALVHSGRNQYELPKGAFNDFKRILFKEL